MEKEVKEFITAIIPMVLKQKEWMRVECVPEK